MRVHFNEDKHIYTDLDTGNILTSVTTVLGRYKQPFDRDAVAQRVADREGVPVQVVINQWESEKDKACEKGTKIHKLLEDYILTEAINPKFNWLYNSYTNAVTSRVGNFNKVYSEEILHYEEALLAGTADLIYTHADGTFTIGDFKTNKRFRFYSEYSEHLKYPVSHLQNCEFSIYTLQLSMYAFFYENITGKKCRQLVVFYLDKGQFIPYNCNYLKSDVENIIKNFKPI